MNNIIHQQSEVDNDLLLVFFPPSSEVKLKGGSGVRRTLPCSDYLAPSQ